MASSSSSISHPVTKKYDVFISFRGEDTRFGFTSHLRKALLDKGIDTYTDNKIRKGQELGAELVNAIKDSTIFLVIFSENYASSSWCLNELVQLMECMKQEPHHVHVIPVFYNVDPSNVRKLRESYGIAFAKHKSDGKVSEDKMQQWKDTLFHAANLSGFHSRNYGIETDMIEAIIKAVSDKLNHKYTSIFTSHFIYDENYTRIESLLKKNSKQVRVIGIWGMGGIGKTSLATAIFSNVSSQYEGTCFLANVAEESKRHGLNYLQQKLHSDLLGEDVHIDTTNMIGYSVGKRLMRKKVLIVLDSVNTSRLLLKLIGDDHGLLGAGSRIIVTTRDKQVLISGNVDKIHEVKLMNSQDSLKLFCLKAFHKTYPEKGYEELSNRATNYAKGIPLALEILGSLLHSKREKNEWDSALLKLEKNPNGEIQEVLKLSFDRLDPLEKKIFLDIACFLKGQERGFVTKILNACNFFADIGIARLIEKALVTTNSYNNHIEMHNLIEEMGREIVRQESPENPGQRSRLWDPEDVYDVLTNNKGTDAVEVIWSVMTQIAPIKISSKAFRKMPNLRFLVFQSIEGEFGRMNSINFSECLEFLPKKLIYFRWDGYPLKSLPSTFCPEKLVELRMPHSNVKKLWQGVLNLPNLEKIYLSGCKHLVECPNLSGAPKLKRVEMRGCKSLSSVDPSLFSLPKLEILDLVACKSLKTLSGNICSQSLIGLFLRASGLNELPLSILHVRNLKTFSFLISYALVDLPENFALNFVLSESREQEHESFFILQKALPSPGFKSLTGLILEECQSLFEIPDSISSLSLLIYLTLYNCGIKILPESIKHLPKLEVLEFSECKLLQRIPELPLSIRKLCVWRCQSLQTVLCSIIESSKTPKRLFLLPNCMTLDEHSYDAILKGAIVKIELEAKQEVLENEQNASTTDNSLSDPAKVSYSLPVRSGKVRHWFHCHYTDASVPIKQQLPDSLLGFIFYMIVSPVQSHHIGCCESIGCEYYLETSPDEERINRKSFFFDKTAMLSHPPPFEFTKDHVFLWYDGKLCKQIRKVIKERKASNSGDQKLTFKFFTQKLCNKEAQIIKECGFRWICSSQEGARKSKRSREGSESNDGREETLPPTKKFKSGTSNLEAEETLPPTKKFKSGTSNLEAEETLPPTKKFKSGTSNLEAEETEELRCLLEELLHI